MKVENFKALRLATLESVGGFVLVAGPNGSGKSCLLDALRILKSHYGGYVPNEIDQLYNEFQLDTNNPRKLRPLFRDPDAPIRIECAFTLSKSEVEYVRENIDSLLEEYAWRQFIGRQYGDNTALYQQRLLMAAQNPQAVSAISERVTELRKSLLEALAADHWHLSLTARYGSVPTVTQQPLFSMLFSTYAPDRLGIVDYHSASRSYGREVVGGLSVDLAQRPTLRGDQSLYNTGGKYQGIKTEIVNAYVRELIRKDVGIQEPDAEQADIDSTLAELFELFFPDKSYDGVRIAADGTPEFPVSVGSGGSHDLNELSSGEKEVLYGYLRLRSATPRNSIILLDEPELHLNPALLRNLPQFYNTHIGKARNNQLILVTHSDALLRPVVGNEEYQIIHLTPAGAFRGGEDQASVVSGEDELEKAVIALIGDVATYTPAGKILILEGGGGAEINDPGFDRTMISALFPNFSRRVNIISGRDKTRVSALLEVLGNADVASALRAKFYAVVDHDSFVDGRLAGVPDANLHEWPVYHIENFLLNDDVLTEVVCDLTLARQSTEETSAGLAAAARELVDELAFRAVRTRINREITSGISLGDKAGKSDPALALAERVSNSAERVKAIAESLHRDAIEGRLNSMRSELSAAVDEGSWRTTFPARDVLKRFVKRTFRDKVRYELVRNSIISRMASRNIQPEDMRKVLARIDPDSFADEVAASE